MTSPEAIRRGWERRRVAIAARFWDRMDRSGGPDACWPWTGRRQSLMNGGRHGGYGTFLVRGEVRYAHRHALELTLGRPLAVGENALHSCDNPPCCNPAHLRVGNQADNSRDAYVRGRWTPPNLIGERHPMARLTEADVLVIRQRAAQQERHRSIAASFGLSPDYISEIVTGRSWAHLPIGGST